MTMTAPPCAATAPAIRCGWCGVRFTPERRNVVCCSRQCGNLMRRRRAGIYPRGVCPRCGRRDYVHESADYGTCLTCGYYPGSSRSAGLVVTRGNDPQGGMRRQQAQFDEAGVEYVTRPTKYWDA